MNPYVTGCKHFRDPVPETEYNSFASQSDDVIHDEFVTTLAMTT